MANHELWKSSPQTVLTTGIGSLPHANVDAALAFSFSMSVPFLPQLPIRYPSEFMIAQALDQLPGVSFDENGCGVLDYDQWKGGARNFQKRLDTAFSSLSDADAFAAFEPSREVWNAWTPFLWELEERKVAFAKIQLAGPLTSQWALRLSDGQPAARRVEVATQVMALVLARAVAMSRKLRSLGVTPLFYLDEPGLYGFASTNANQLLALQELRIFVQTLGNEGVLVGLHCCSNTDWAAILSLPLDVLSIDTGVSLGPLLQHGDAVRRFIDGGGRFSFGIVPTGVHAVKLRAYRPELLFSELVGMLGSHFKTDPVRVDQLLKNAVFTPACGLALHSVEASEAILHHLLEIGDICGLRLRR